MKNFFIFDKELFPKNFSHLFRNTLYIDKIRLFFSLAHIYIIGNCVNEIHCTINPKVTFDRHYCIQCIEISEYIRSTNEREDKIETNFVLRIRAGFS